MRLLTLRARNGKALLGLKVERVAGRKPGFLWAVGRVSLGYFIVDVLGAGVLASPSHRVRDMKVIDS